MHTRQGLLLLPTTWAIYILLGDLRIHRAHSCVAVMRMQPTSSTWMDFRVSLRRFPFRALNFSSASCQQSLEVGDNSAGEVHEEVQVQQIATLEEEKRREPVKRAQLHERVLAHVSLEPEQEVRLRGSPLRAVVESCVKRWFKDHVKAAEKGDLDAQVTVGQMICHGYGVPKDVNQGEEWIRRAQCKRKFKQRKEPQNKTRPEDEDFFFI